MASQDPYYGSQQYPPAQREYDEPFNPYSNEQPHRTYDQAGYNYDSGGGYNGNGYKDELSGAAKEISRTAYEEVDDVVPNRPRAPRTPRNLRQWRYEHNDGLWTRGGGVRSCGRFFCCTIMIAVFLIISIVLSLALWIRPPNVTLDNIGIVQNSSAVTFGNDTLNILFDANVSVSNPNYFPVFLTDFKINLTYPINNTAVGGGETKNINFGSHSQKNVTFPATLQYNISDNPNLSVLGDLAKKCGIVPGVSSSDITIDYKATISVRILFVHVSPTITGSTSFECPLSSADIGQIIKDSGLNLGDLGSLLKRQESVFG